MTVFKTFWKILNKNKITVIFFTMLLVIFSASNLKTSDNNMRFEASKPTVFIVNNEPDDLCASLLVIRFEDDIN